MRWSGCLLLCGVLSAGKAWADPSSQSDSGAASKPTSAQLTLGHARALDADPFQLSVEPLSVWWSPALAGRAAAPPLFSPFLATQLTLRMPSILGLQPLFALHPRLPLGGSPGLGSDFSLRYALGRFQTGTTLSFSRDARGLLLNSSSFVRYVAPTYHLGLQDHAVWPLTSSASILHSLTASAGVKPATTGPALRVSSSLGSGSQQPRWGGALSGFF